MATKSNALKYSMVLWDRLFEEIAPEFPAVQAEKAHVDALSMQFVRCPQRLDVVVASNLFGDILSDLAAAITGSLGLAPSANINPERTAPSLFEPVHGSAPDIAGQGIANPIAAIRSAAMMLDFLGESAAAQAIDQAVIASLRASTLRTPDLGGTATTTQVGDDITARIMVKSMG
jgi:tartrate dehydrogenase/decarboxylase/D-malate dehydrogenase